MYTCPCCGRLHSFVGPEVRISAHASPQLAPRVPGVAGRTAYLLVPLSGISHQRPYTGLEDEDDDNDGKTNDEGDDDHDVLVASEAEQQCRCFR